jgi:hypothetical protein
MFAFAIDIWRFARRFALHATKFLTALYLARTGWMGTFLAFGGHRSNPFGQKASATQSDVKQLSSLKPIAE